MVSDTIPTDEIPIACDPSAVAPDRQEYWVKEIVPKLYRAVQEIQDLPNGYAWRLPSDPEILMLIAEDLNIERLCCPFLRYTLEIEPNGGPFWLRMTGGKGVKEFLQMSFEAANMFDEEVAKAACFNISDRRELDSVKTALETINRVNEHFAKAAGSS